MKLVPNTKVTRCHERGAAYFEFLVVLPVILLLSAAVADFGRALKEYIALQNTAYFVTRVLTTSPGLAEGCYSQLDTGQQATYTRARNIAIELMQKSASLRNQVSNVTIELGFNCSTLPDVGGNRTVAVRLSKPYAPLFARILMLSNFRLNLNTVTTGENLLST